MRLRPAAPTLLLAAVLLLAPPQPECEAVTQQDVLDVISVIEDVFQGQATIVDVVRKVDEVNP
jgi:hypothetical protein